MVRVQQWAEIRRMHEVEGLSIRAINRRTGVHRKTITRALESPEPPRYSRAPTGSKLDPFKEEIRRLLKGDPAIPSMRIRELITELGYSGGKTICDDYVRELRPLLAPPRTFQRTCYRAAEICQFDLWEPKREIAVGWGQTRRGYMVTAALGYSRALAGALVFSKESADVLWGMRRCLCFLGALPETLVWDREGAVHAGAGRPTEAFAAFCGALPAGWIILDRGDAPAKGLLERGHRFMRTSFEPARSFASELDYQDQFDRWVTERANPRYHQGIRAVPAERLVEERGRMRALPDPMPRAEERFTLRVPPQPYFRFDRNDYSLDPRLVGRRVEIRAAQRAIVAVSLDTGQIAASHRRVFAGALTFTDPAHQAALDQMRGERTGRRQKPEVEVRPLARYDALIPA